jgi:hypothetical protein
MPAFSPGRDTIFASAPAIVFQINGFPDFYAILGVSRDASNSELENAITSRGADLLTASFSRGGKAEFITLLERHMTDFRPILLHRVARLSYDEQLRRHETNDARALDFNGWKNQFASRNILARGLQTASSGVKARFKAAFWDAEYF